MSMYNSNLPSAPNTVKWYHKVVAAPLRFLSHYNIGPLGGENSISAVIEAVLAEKRGEAVEFELSKTDLFFKQQLTKIEPPDPMVEYRELNHEAQRQILKIWPDEQPMAVIWLGAGVFTLYHPLLAERGPKDWHLWSDKNPKIVSDARAVFDEMLARGEVGKMSYDITLPQDVNKLNSWIKLMTSEIKRLVIFGYGVTYALTTAENYAWLSQLELPDNVDVLFVFNSPGQHLDFLPAVTAAHHQQLMVYYQTQDIEALFKTAVPGSRIIWEKPRSQTRNKLWGTWLISRPAIR